jgi:hypothetical protein
MNKFQITWDSKDSKTTDNDSLRLDIVMMIIQDNPEHELYQPTESTIIFKSESDFNTWNQRLLEFKKNMYYSICQIFPDFYHDNPSSEIDVKTVVDNAEKRIPGEIIYEITLDDDAPKISETTKESFREKMKDALKKQRPDENENQAPN